MKSENITILLTLFNRDFFTMSFLEAYASSKTAMPLLIADSSETNSNRDIVMLFLKEYPTLKIKYTRHKIDTSYNTMLDKFCDALDSIETKYCMFADNDDFLYYKNIEKSVFNFNKGIAMISGDVYLERCFSKICFHTKVFDKNIEGKDPVKRIAAHSSNYAELWYSVSETKIKQKIIKKYAHIDISDINMLYPFFSFEHLWFGGYKIIHKNFLIRKISGTSIQSSLKDQRMNVLLNPEFSKQLSLYIDVFIKDKDLTRDEVIRMFSEVYDQRYFNKYVSLFLKTPIRILIFLKKRMNIKRITFKQKTPGYSD